MIGAVTLDVVVEATVIEVEISGARGPTGPAGDVTGGAAVDFSNVNFAAMSPAVLRALGAAMVAAGFTAPATYSV